MLARFPLFLDLAGVVFHHSLARLVITKALAFVATWSEKACIGIEREALQCKDIEKYRKRVFRHDVVEDQVVTLEIRELLRFGNSNYPSLSREPESIPHRKSESGSGQSSAACLVHHRQGSGER